MANKSKVFFTSFRVKPGQSILKKITDLVKKLKLNEQVKKNQLVGIKTHFGERGNTAYIRPVFFQPIIEHLQKLKVKPFLTDTNTLYVGMRSNSVDHTRNAILNGFSYSSLGIPVLIADGLRSKNVREVEIDLKHFKTAYLAEDILSADFMVIVSHFKGHEMTGFGGAMKNLAMGCAGRHGKLDMHSRISPSVTTKKCVGCGTCVEWCPVSAISLNDKKAGIDSETCIGCGECIIICPVKAIRINWNEQIPVFQEKLIEYVYAYHSIMKGKSVYINFINSVSPACDCFGGSDAPIVGDIGIMASYDPIAIDRASLDMVDKAHGNSASALPETGHGKEKFKLLYPQVDYETQFQYAEKLGIGSTEYELIEL